ncbi:MAG: T9SS type A sorting domain-containing protein [Bacteroidetes bacterium]|nr:T9SS type A sorting domain-containing protein [Bacteroidota bacterium]
MQTGNYNYKFVNGNTSSGYEYVSGACAVGGQRSVALVQDVMLDPVNFSSCLVSVAENNFQENISMYPNPAKSDVKIEFNDAGHSHSVAVLDLAGRKILSIDNIGNDYLQIDRKDLQSGIYFVNIFNSEGSNACLKLIVQ